MKGKGGAPEPERLETVIVGAGQAGLAVGYQLAALGRPFVILDANGRVGDSWRKRWDSLRLFSPARFDALPGMPFPAPRDSFPSKDDMANYLEAYAMRFELPVRTGSRVNRLWKEQGRYRLATDAGMLEAENVVIAMASYQSPRIPAFASTLSADIVQLHSLQYRNVAQLQDGAVLIVGAGNSAAEIALEIARFGHPTNVSGRATGEVPFRIDGAAARLFLGTLLFRVIFHRLLTVDTPMGRRARPKALGRATPLIRTRERDLAAVGVARVPRTVGVRDGKPVLEDGRVLEVTNVVWCTGFDLGLSWIDLPIFDGKGEPKHSRGIVAEQPGVFFVGQHFLYSMSSAMIHGVGRDAERIANAIAARVSRREGAGRRTA